MEPTLDRLVEVVSVFEASIASVKQTASFDRLVMDTTIGMLEVLESRLREDHGIDNPRLTAQLALQNMRNIRENDSLRPKYEEMFNQCAVLLVSHFGAALGDLFRHGVTTALASGVETKLNHDEIKLTIQENHDLRFDFIF